MRPLLMPHNRVKMKMKFTKEYSKCPRDKHCSRNVGVTKQCLQLCWKPPVEDTFKSYDHYVHGKFRRVAAGVRSDKSISNFTYRLGCEPRTSNECVTLFFLLQNTPPA